MEEWKAECTEGWVDFCNLVESKGGPVGEFVSRKILKRIVVNSPVLLGFVLICTLIHGCSVLYPGLRPILGVDDRFTEFWNPFSYLSLFTHVLAHDGWAHLQGNMVHMLLVGPAVEHAFGSKNLFYIIVLVAVSSAFVHLAIGKENTYQLGASGVVFACILLSSMVTASAGTIPLSFLIVATWWLGDEFWKFFFCGRHSVASCTSLGRNCRDNCWLLHPQKEGRRKCQRLCQQMAQKFPYSQERQITCQCGSQASEGE